MSINIDPSDWKLKTEKEEIPYLLKDGFPIGTFEEENATAQEVYIIEADRLLDFAIESLPAPTIFDDFYVKQRKRTQPGQDNLITKSIGYKPLDQGKPCNPFGFDENGAEEGTYTDFVEVTINYSTGKQQKESGGENDPNTFLEISSEATGEVLMLPSRGTWVGESAGDLEDPNNDTQPEGVNTVIARLIPEIEWTVRWTQVPANFYKTVLTPVMRGLMGKINNVPMALLNNAPLNSILFLGWSDRDQFTWQAGFVDNPPVEVEMKFLEKNLGPAVDGGVIGHNHFYQEKTGDFTIWRTPNGNPVFTQGNLNAMFPPEVG